MPLKGSPESFQFDDTGSRIFVKRTRALGKDRGSMSPKPQADFDLETAGASSNFAMAVDPLMSIGYWFCLS